MLQSLSIRNVVLIDKLDIDFKPQLSVLTGETAPESPSCWILWGWCWASAPKHL